MCLTLSFGCWLSQTVPPSTMELLHVSHILLLLLAVSNSLSSPIEYLHVSHCLPWLLAVSHFLSGPIELLHISHCLL